MGMPLRLGRYDIVGRLATGGMAEVLLGRLQGPHGFERPVVIKRILPHLVLQPGVVDMFLDEARIIANLSHPNLIHVHELGRDGQELFMAMEYLEGESLSGLCRRLASRNEDLDFDLAAHIMAEACAGVHAAHEATSADGRALEIVHRDISPQNIFVTYAGTVHVIDFGIATTADRISRTEVGTVRGKVEYLAPEQLHSLPLDRRADIFGLGVVLLELASGRRIYRRSSHAETLMAILADPVPKLTALRPDAPLPLEAIGSRALAKSRRDRFQTAAEMRRELLTFVRKRTDADLGEELAKVMRVLFAERMAEKGEMLRHVREGANLEQLPAAEVDTAIELPMAATQTATLSRSVSVSGWQAASGGTAHRLPRMLVLSMLVAMVGGLGAVSVGWWRSAHALAKSATAAASSASRPPGVDLPATTIPAVDERSARTERPAGEVEPAPSPPAAAARTRSRALPTRGVPHPAAVPSAQPVKDVRPEPILW